MAIADMASITAKVNKYMASAAHKKAVDAEIDKEAPRIVSEAADYFIDVMRSAIASSGVSANVAAAISDMSHGAPIKIGSGQYTIYIDFSNNLYRPSLDPAHYGGINNLAALYNNGAKGGEKMKQVHGVWHGKEYWSNPVIPERNFVQSAINTFMSAYGGEFKSVIITPSSIYK